MNGPASGVAPGGRSLSSRVAVGVGWLFGRTLLTKILSLLGQLVLARLLTDEDYGLFALCLIALTTADLVGQAGVKQVVVQRGRRFSLWSGPATWMNAIGGVGAATVVFAMGPLLSVMYDAPLTPLLAVLSIDAFLRPLTQVPRAKLEIDMRFGALALCGVVETVVLTGSMITLAVMEQGVMSLVLARPITAAVMLVTYYGVSGYRPTLRPRVRRWKHLLGRTAFVMGAVLLWKLTQQGDNAILGLFVSKAEVGSYFFAFGLSSQTLFLVTLNLQSVMMPALSSIASRPDQQREVLMRGARTAAVVIVPICVGLTLCSSSLVPLVYGEKWQQAGDLLGFIAIAMVFRGVTPLLAVLLDAQARFADTMRAYFISVCVFIPLVTLGSMFGGAAGCAAALILYGFVEQVVFLKISQAGRGALRTMWDVYRTPLLISLLPAVLAAVAVVFNPMEPGLSRRLATIGVAGVYGVVYGFLLFYFFPGVLVDAPKGVRNRLPGALMRRLDARAAAIAAKRTPAA